MTNDKHPLRSDDKFRNDCRYCHEWNIAIRNVKNDDSFLYYAVCLECGAETNRYPSIGEARYAWNNWL